MSDGPKRAKGIELPRTKSRIDADVRAEMQFHFEERVAELVRDGATREAAEADVRSRFGDYEEYRRVTRDIDEQTDRQLRRASFISTLGRELRHAVRALARHRTFSAVAFITLTLGIASSTAMFAVVDAVVLRPLPYTGADRLVSVLHPATVPGSGERRWGVSPGGFFHIQQHNRVFASFGIYASSGLTVTNGGDAEVAQIARITQSVQDVLSATPALGRLMSAEDDAPGAAPVAVLSYEYFQRRFGGDPTVVGRNLETSSGTFEIVGVMRSGMTLPMPGPFASTANLAGFGVDVWTALRLNPAGPFYNNHPFVGVGRLRDGVTVDAAQRDMTGLLTRFVEWMPNAYSAGFLSQYNFRIEARPLRDAVLGEELPRALWMLFAAVLLVLLIATANVANLFLVRTELRRHEAGVRTALGADRTHMAAHYLAESLLICLSAAGAAVLVAHLAVRGVLAIAPTSIPRLAQVTLEWPAVAFALAVGLVLGLSLGLAPLARLRSSITTLREGARGSTTSVAGRWVRQLLVGGQVALTLMLLSCGALLLNSAQRLRNVHPGFDATDVLAFGVELPFREFDTRAKGIAFHREFAARLAALPGVAAAGAGQLPFEGYGTGCTVVFREGRPFGADEQTPCVSTPTAMPGFFEALRIQVQGRIPDWGDVGGRTQAAVVTRVLATRLWPGEDPIGKGIASNGSDSDVWYRVVGVVPNLRAEALDADETEAVFYPLTGLRSDTLRTGSDDLTYVVRARDVDPLSLVASIRSLLREMNPLVPMDEPRTMEAVMARSVAGVTFSVVLMSIAGMMGLVLSAVGLYGLTAHLVAARRPEIGVRIAMGAGKGDVLRLVLTSVLRVTMVGLVVGIAGALATGRLMQGFVFGAQGMSAALVAMGAVVILLIVLVASWGPALRALRVDPVEAIRGA